MATGAVILAAGESKQMRAFKPLMCIGGKPMIRRLYDSLAEARISPIVVVTGYHAEQIERCLEDTKAILVQNRQYRQTDMFFSICLGIKRLPQKCSRAFIMPADIPMVLPGTLKKLSTAEGSVVIPSFRNQAGHPVRIDRSLFDKIEQYEGEDGLRGFLTQTEKDIVFYPIEDEGILMDANTDEEYLALQNLEAKRAGKGKLHLTCDFQLSVENLVIDRQIMHLLEMVDYTGSLQTASECMDLSYTQCWRQIKSMEKELGFQVVESVAGGQRGGGTRLTEKGKDFLETYQQFISAGDRILELLFREHFPASFV